MDGRTRAAGESLASSAAKSDPGSAHGDGALRACAADRRGRHGVPAQPRRAAMAGGWLFLYTEHRWQCCRPSWSGGGRQRPIQAGTRCGKTRHGGAVACDGAGTWPLPPPRGGMTGKLPGRVGDCPVFGACTLGLTTRPARFPAPGHGAGTSSAGERRRDAARIRHRGEGLEAASKAVIDELEGVGGSGGLYRHRCGRQRGTAVQLGGD